ncbi:hypothetical protein ZWY2020_002356 [Hordeum vulgare]|nr:hypothetical protein ZWY2020_025247 [Hordeum vulgare]KAI4971442.1 hypothetical protein ZWY2020_002356 [Hordeum vulgare]
MSSSSSSSGGAGSALGGSHAGLALAATAMALSGTLVLFSLCRAKQTDHHLLSSDAAVTSPSPARLRPCLSSSEKRKREKARRGSMKRVRFAADVVDHGPARPAPEEETAAPEPSCRGAAMPANREALYRGMLRGRSMLRTACSY